MDKKNIETKLQRPEVGRYPETPSLEAFEAVALRRRELIEQAGRFCLQFDQHPIQHIEFDVLTDEETPEEYGRLSAHLIVDDEQKRGSASILYVAEKRSQKEPGMSYGEIIHARTIDVFDSAQEMSAFRSKAAIRTLSAAKMRDEVDSLEASFLQERLSELSYQNIDFSLDLKHFIDQYDELR